MLRNGALSYRLNSASLRICKDDYQGAMANSSSSSSTRVSTIHRLGYYRTPIAYCKMTLSLKGGIRKGANTRLPGHQAQ
jgi:hypothetical protein